MTEKEEFQNPAPFYNFQERLGDTKNRIKECFQEIVKLGFDPAKTRFSIKNVSEAKQTAHFCFSDYVMQLFSKVTEHGDIRKTKKALEKTLAAPIPVIKFLVITRKEIVVKGEVGFSLMNQIIERTCQKIKKELVEKIEEKRKRILKEKERMISKAKDIISKLPSPEEVRGFYKKKNYHLVIIFYRSRKRGYKKERSKFPPGFISGIKVTGTKVDAVIDQLKEIVDSFILREGAN